MYSNRDGPRPAVNYYRKGRPLCSERQIEKKRQRHHAAGSRFADKAQSAGNLARERLQFSVQSSQFTVAFIAGTTQRKAQSAGIMVANRRHPATPTPPPGLEFRRKAMFIEQERPNLPATLIGGIMLKPKARLKEELQMGKIGFVNFVSLWETSTD